MNRLAILCGLSDEKAILAGSPHLVLCGATQRDALARLVPAGVTGLVSFGVCGGLVRQISFGDLLLAREARTAAGTFAADAAWSARILARLPHARRVPFWSDPTESAETPAARQTLAARSGAWAVDQETRAVAALAAVRKLPWIALRSPSDIWNQAVAPDTDNFTRPDGSPDLGHVLADILERPADLPNFIQDAQGYDRALTALRHAYQTLGPDFGLAV